LIVVPYIREILGGIIFFKNKKNLVAHLAHPFFKLKVLVLLTNSCAKPFGTVGTLSYLTREAIFISEKTL